MRDKHATWLALAAAALAAGSSACSADEPRCLAPSARPPSIQLGSGVGVYEPLVEGGTIRAYQGPQGGFHVMLGLRATGIAPGAGGEVPSSCATGDATAPCVTMTVTDLTLGRTISAFSPLHLPLSCTADETEYELAPRQVVLDIEDLAEVDGHLFELVATVLDSAGVVLESRLSATCTLL